MSNIVFALLTPIIFLTLVRLGEHKIVTFDLYVAGLSYLCTVTLLFLIEKA